MEEEKLRASVFGLGYVGAVSSACFTDLGHTVVGVDINQLKVDLILSGKSPIVEPGVEELIRKGLEDGRLTVTTDVADAVVNTDVSLVAVGTPSARRASSSSQRM